MDSSWASHYSDIKRVSFSAFDAMKGSETDQDSSHDAEKFSVVMEGSIDDLVSTTKITTEGEPDSKQPRATDIFVLVPTFFYPINMTLIPTKKPKATKNKSSARRKTTKVKREISIK